MHRGSVVKTPDNINDATIEIILAVFCLTIKIYKLHLLHIHLMRLDLFLIYLHEC
jgi:hypothetical protein